MSHKAKVSEKKNEGQPVPAIGRERTPAEIAVIEQQAERIAETLAAPKIQDLKRDGGTLKLVVATGDEELYHALDARAFGTADKDVSNWMHNLMANAIGAKNLTTDSINGFVGMMHALQPRDEIEGMLISQMIAVHAAASTTAGKFNAAEPLKLHSELSTTLNKLMRTFTTQMEALNRYRGKGQQKMTVEHVHVHEGGQAIVGTVEHTGGRGFTKKSGTQPHAVGPQMRGDDAGGEILPRAGHA